MVRYLTENEVKQILTMPKSIELMERAFRDRAEGNAFDTPRRRVRQPQGTLNIQQGAAPLLNVIGFKHTYAAAGRHVSLVHLHDQAQGSLEAMIEASWMGQMRTAATTAVAVNQLARADASVVACLGTGRHAAFQLEAVCAVRRIREARAYGRNQERLANFCSTMSRKLGIEVRASRSPQQALAGAHLVNVMTRAETPVFDGHLLEPGQHVTAAGGNSLDRREIDLVSIGRSSVVVVDSRETAQLECGDLLPAVEAGLIYWENIADLGDVLVGRRPGRTSDAQITLFESHGMCIEDLYVGKYVLDAARERNIGKDIAIAE